jgi:hypothetical protein
MKPAVTTGERCAFVLVVAGAALVWGGIALLVVTSFWE